MWVGSDALQPFGIQVPALSSSLPCSVSQETPPWGGKSLIFGDFQGKSGGWLAFHTGHVLCHHSRVITACPMAL